MKAYRLTEAQAEAAIGQRDLVRLLAATRQQADAARRLRAIVEDEEVAARRPAADAPAVSATEQRVGDCAAGDGDVGIGVVQHPQWRATPGAEGCLQAFGERGGAKDAAIEQQRVGDRDRLLLPVFAQSLPCRRRVPSEEGRKMAADRRVGGVGQAELDDRRPPLLQTIVNRHLWQESVDQQLAHFVATQFDGACAAEQPGTAAEQCQQNRLGRVGSEQLLLRPAAACGELRKAGRRQARFAGRQA